MFARSRGLIRLFIALLATGVPPLVPLHADFTAEWRQVWEDFRRTYSYFDHKKVDWNQVWKEHEHDFESVTDPTLFAEKLNDILQVLRDWHVAVQKPSGEFIGYRGEVHLNFDPQKFFRTRYTGGMAYQNVKNAGALVHSRFARGRFDWGHHASSLGPWFYEVAVEP